jgi:hypothetical protein
MMSARASTEDPGLTCVPPTHEPINLLPPQIVTPIPRLSHVSFDIVECIKHSGHQDGVFRVRANINRRHQDVILKLVRCYVSHLDRFGLILCTTLCSFMLTIRHAILGGKLGRICSTPNVKPMPILYIIICATMGWYRSVMVSLTFPIGIQQSVVRRIRCQINSIPENSSMTM